MAAGSRQGDRVQKNETESTANPLGLSIENYPLEESRQLVASPRSLEACRIEGVLPEQLLYK